MRSIQKRKIAQVFDQKAQGWSRKGRRSRVLGHDNPLEALVPAYTPRGAVVVDIGGGDGGFLAKNLLGAKASLMVFDLSRHMARRAVEALAGSTDDVGGAAVADAVHLPLKSDSCDLALVRQVLHHVLSPQEVVDEVWRVLHPGGFLLLQVPGEKFFGDWLPYIGSHTKDELGRFSEREVMALLQGFSAKVWSQQFTFRFASLLDAFEHLLSIATLDRVLEYDPDASRVLRKFFDVKMIGSALNRYSPSPLDVECDYVVAIGRKEIG